MQTEARRRERYCTTGQFTVLDRGYQKHCGPTAATNLVLTLLGTEAPPPAAVFRRVAALGTRRLVYVNHDVLGRWGGTSDLLSGLYLRMVLRAFHLRDVRVGPRRPLNWETLRPALDRGSVLYLQLRRHPKYGDHHLLCYGLEPDGSLRLADGWESRPVALPLRELGKAWFVEVSINK